MKTISIINPKERINNLEDKLLDGKSIRKYAQQHKIPCKGLLELQIALKQHFFCSFNNNATYRAFQAALLERYLQTKIAESSNQTFDHKALLAYKIRNALFDKGNQHLSSQDIVKFYIPNMANIKGWDSHRLFTTLELVSHPEEYLPKKTESLPEKDLARYRYKPIQVNNDPFLKKAYNNTKDKAIDANYNQTYIHETLKDQHDKLERTLPQQHYYFINRLCEFTQQRQRKHHRSQFRFFCFVFGKDLNREGRASLYFANELVQRLKDQPLSPPSEIVKQIVDPDKHQLFKIAGINANHPLNKIVNEMQEATKLASKSATPSTNP